MKQLIQNRGITEIYALLLRQLLDYILIFISPLFAIRCFLGFTVETLKMQILDLRIVDLFYKQRIVKKDMIHLNLCFNLLTWRKYVFKLLCY